MTQEDLDYLLIFFLIFVSFSFNLDNIYLPAFKLTNLFFFCIRSSFECIQWMPQFWYHTFLVLLFPFDFFLIDSISLLKISICLHMLPIFFTTLFPIVIAVILKLLSVNSNNWIISGLCLLNFFFFRWATYSCFFLESHLIVFHCVSNFVYKWMLETGVHSIYL